MARNFNGSTQWATNASAPVAGQPLSIAAWFRSTSTTADQVIAGIGTGTTSNGNYLVIEGSVAGDPVSARSRTGAGAAQARTSSGYSANTWHHACAVFASATDRRAFIDGGSKGTNATSRDPTSVSPFLEVAGFVENGNWEFSGDIAEVAMWNVGLDDDEVASLAKGVCPLLVRPSALVFYAPMIGQFSPEIDVRGKFDLTLTASPATAVHPTGLYYPAGLLLPESAPPDQNINGTGISIGVTFGSPVVAIDQNIEGSGLAVGVTFGDHVVAPDQELQASGFAVSVAFGDATVTPAITCSGFAVSVAFGSATVIPDQFVYASGLAVSVTFGGATVGHDNTRLVANAKADTALREPLTQTELRWTLDRIRSKKAEKKPFVGANETQAGWQGLVPTPAVGDSAKVLLGDGTWGRFTHGCVVSKGSAQAIPTGGISPTAVTWTTEVLDPFGYFNSASSTTNVIAPKAGYYIFFVDLDWETNVTGERVLTVDTSEGASIYHKREAPTPGGYSYMNFSGVVHLNAGAYFTVRAYQDSGGDLDLSPFGGNRLALFLLYPD